MDPRLREQIPEELAEALDAMLDEEFSDEMAEAYLAADSESQLDILELIQEGGPEMMRQAYLKHEEGIPTSADLEDQFQLRSE